MGIRRKSIGLLYAFTMFAMCLSLLTFQQTGKAQESESGFNEQQREHSTSIHPSATIQKEIDIRLSEDDLSVWTNSSRNVYGDWTWTLPSDSEILNIDYTGESHTVTDNVIEFTELDGYVEVIYRTATGIERDGATITFASDWSVTAPFDLIAQVSFPEFYSSYITSIFPEQGHTLSPGHITWNLNTIDEWSFEVLFDFGLDITEVTFLDGNKNAHHTKPWPDWVFRRVQWISVHTTFDGIFDEDTDSLRWSVKSSSESDFTEIPAWTPALADDSWAVRESDVEGQSFIAEIFIPANVAIEDYTVKVTAYRNTGEGSVLLDSAESPSFMVIFNPWNDDDDPRYDQDVHNTAFSNQELQTYAASGTGHNYYGGENNDELVRWVLNPYTRQVFTTAFEEIKGTTSAQAAMEQLVDKVQVDDDDAIPEDSEVLRGRWGPPYNYRVNWRNAPAIVQAWETGSDHPTGQCMDFGGLLAAFGRSVGVPTRMITCVNCDGWNFHVWNEMWLNNDGGGAWYPADGTPGYQIGPTSRSDPSFQEEVSTSIAVYTHDANSSSRLDLLALYRSSLLADLQTVDATSDGELQTVSIVVETDQPTYTFGESVNIEVTATNTDASSVSGSLQTVVSYVDYAGSYEVLTFPARNVTIPTGQSVVETYTFEQADYEWNGEFMVAATLNDTQGEASFTINYGLEVKFDMPETIAQGEALPVSLYITNTLDTSLSNVEVEVFFPPNIEGFDTPVQITIPGLTPGETYIESWNITPAEARAIASNSTWYIAV